MEPLELRALSIKKEGEENITAEKVKFINASKVIFSCYVESKWEVQAPACMFPRVGEEESQLSNLHDKPQILGRTSNTHDMRNEHAARGRGQVMWRGSN